MIDSVSSIVRSVCSVLDEAQAAHLDVVRGVVLANVATVNADQSVMNPDSETEYLMKNIINLSYI